MTSQNRMSTTDRYIEVRRVAAQVIASGAELDHFRRFFVKAALDSGPTLAKEHIVAYIENDCDLSEDRRNAWLSQVERSHRPTETFAAWLVWLMTVDQNVAVIAPELYNVWKLNGALEKADPFSGA